ncbi:MAG: GntR family transcriptional regulator [Clostridia bacterium]|nr:GntR family transcriptional regulator [Clostridia bacterium]MBR5714152.1 GntR family transcriptional regulator [Clostridia bacterium]
MFNIDKMSRTPLYEQLIEQFESCILSGDIGEDGKLPSVRYLSQHLNINPNTLQRAYAEIERRGLCYSVPGNGRFISPDALKKLSEQSLSQTAELEALVTALRQKGVPMNSVLEVVRRAYDVSDNLERKEDL